VAKHLDDRSSDFASMDLDDAAKFVNDAPIGAQVCLNSEGGQYEYEARPDADVFDWDEARMEAVESYQKNAKYGLLGPGRVIRKIRHNYEDDLETKKVLVKARRAQGLLLSSDKRAASILPGTSLQEVRRVISAKNSHDRRQENVIRLASFIIVFSTMVAATLVGLWVGSRHGWWLFLLGPAEWLVTVLSALFIIYSIEATRWSWHRPIAAAILIWFIAAAFIVGLRYHNHNPGLLLEFSAGVTVAGLIFLAGTTIILLITEAFDYRGQGAQPEAILFVDLLLLISIALEWEVADDKRQELIARIEEAAKRAERTFRYAVRHDSTRLRKWGANRGRKIAAVIQKHEERVLEVSKEQRCLITVSLTNGLAYLLRGDWDSFLTVEPEGEVKSLVRRYAPRVALATLLVVLAFLLPHLIPQVIKDSLSFKTTLLVTAGFTIISPDIPKAADVVRSSLSNS
jgi:hypothetical protein